MGLYDLFLMSILGGWFIILIFKIAIIIATVMLAKRKGRNGLNWFFLSLFWGVLGLIILACADKINREEGDRDTLAKVLWIIVVIPIIINLVILFKSYNEIEYNIKDNYEYEQIVYRTVPAQTDTNSMDDDTYHWEI